MPDVVRTRTYQPDDLDRCRELWVELTNLHRDLYDRPRVGEDELGRELDEHVERVGAENIVVAERGGEIVGFAGLIPGDQPELEPVIVTAGARGSGVGHALVEAVFEIAKARGIHRLMVRPVARNGAALGFFRELGFHTLGQVELLAWLTPGARWGRAGATVCDVELDV